MTDLTPTIAALTWLNQIPHTLDDCCRIARELAGRDRTEAAKARGGGNGGGSGISDPTGEAAIRTALADDALDVATTMLAAGETIRAHTACACSMLHEATGKPYRACATLSEALTDLGTLRAMQATTALLGRDDLDDFDLNIYAVVESVAWLVPKAQSIYELAPHKMRDRVEQKPRRSCVSCARFAITADVDRYADRCRRCGQFEAEHGCQPTERICRTWDAGINRVTPGMVLEAKAQGRKRKVAASGR